MVCKERRENERKIEKKGQPQLYIIQLAVVLALLFRMRAFKRALSTNQKAEYFHSISYMSFVFVAKLEGEAEQIRQRDKKGCCCRLAANEIKT